MLSRTIAVGDAGPLIASVHAGDQWHAASRALFGRRDLHFVVPAVVLCEAFYMIGRRGGPPIEAPFLRSLARRDVLAPTPDDFVRMAELVEQYANLPLGGSDASVIALAERLGAATIATVDRRHFSVVRPRHVERFTLLPE
jgi:predicted nucleic acid-binding protein